MCHTAAPWWPPPALQPGIWREEAVPCQRGCLRGTHSLPWGKPECCCTERPEGVSQVVWGSGSVPRGALGRLALWAATQMACPGLGQVCWLVVSVGPGQRPDSGAYPPCPLLMPTPTPAWLCRPTLGRQGSHSTGGRGWGHKETESGLVPGLEKNLASHPPDAEGKNRREEELPDGPLALARAGGGGAGGGQILGGGRLSAQGLQLQALYCPQG